MLTLKRRLRRVSKQGFVTLHEIGSRFGLYVLPKHYYVPIPDLRELRQTRAEWARRSDMLGVHVDLEQQQRTLRQIVQPFEAEYRHNLSYKEAVSDAFGPGFGYIEAQALHGFIRSTKPRQIIEIGSGISTHCMIEALAQNAAEGAPASLNCIEPFPSSWLRSAPVNLIESRVENVSLETFETLEAGDFLFVDSTHTLRVGGDVVRIILEILPRLSPGVFIHFHDIYLPFDFQRDVDRSIFQWMETALLHAYLIGNRDIKILFCLSHLHYDRRDALRDVFPEYCPEEDTNGLSTTQNIEGRHFPSSIYLQAIEPSALSSAER